MTLLRFRNGFCLALAFLAVAAVASAAQAPSNLHDASAASVASYALSQQMPVDPDVLVGTLPNGLRYYVRANAKPAHRAELRLVVGILVGWTLLMVAVVAGAITLRGW